MQSLLDHSDAASPGPLSLVWRHKGKAALALALGIACTLLYLSRATRKYQSEAKLFLRVGRESVGLDPTATTGPFMAVADTRGSEVFAVEELMASRPLAEKIVDQFGSDVILERDPEHPGLELGSRLAGLDAWNLNPFRVYSIRDKAIKAFQDSLRVSAGSKTNVLSVSYDCEDPKLAQQVLDALLASVCEEHLRVHRTKGSQDFFVAQTELLKANLAQLEEQSRNLKNETGVTLLSTQRELQLQLIGALRTDLARAQTDRDAVRAELERRRNQLDALPTLSVTEQTIGRPHSTDQSLREKLYDLEVKEQELAAKYTSDHPLRSEIRNQLSEARRIYQVEKPPIEVKTSTNLAHQSAELAVHEREAALVAVTARVQALTEQMVAAQEDVKQLNIAEVEINRLEREIDLARGNCRKYSENLEQARIDHELEEAKISSLSVLQAPTFCQTPVSPKPLPTLAVGLVCAAMASLGVALAAQHRGRRALMTSPATRASAAEHAANGAAEHVANGAATSYGWRSEGVPARPR